MNRGCTSCIRINFTDGEMIFLGIHYDFYLLKLIKFGQGFQKILDGNWSEMSILKFFLWNGTTAWSLHFVLKGYVINQC